MEVISKIALITINETLVAQVISFLVLLFVLNRIMIRPLMEVMQERDEYAEGLKAEITARETEMAEMIKSLEAHEAQVRKEAFGITAEMERAGAEKAAKINASARDEIALLKRNAEKAVEIQISEARKSFEAESEKLSRMIMEKVLNRRLAA